MNISGIFKKNPIRSVDAETERYDGYDAEETAAQSSEVQSPVSPEIPDGLMTKCPKCKKTILSQDLKGLHYTCPKCGHYLRMYAQKRLKLLADPGSFEEWDTGLTTRNPLHLKEYPGRVRSLQESTGLDEAVITGKAKINSMDTVLMIMDCRFLTASMGQVVGEKITRGIERATAEKLPVIIVCCSGGARMQEGMTSLMQMAKTSAALKRHSDAGLLYISVLTDPTTGGVTASFAMLGDIILAEPRALIGFAGPRVIEQTIGQKLPKGFQRSEFLLEHGFIDAIVERENMKNVLSEILALHAAGQNPKVLRKEVGSEEAIADGSETDRSRKHPFDKERAKAKTPWERVQLARAKDRPVAEDYINRLFTDFIEFHGDRNFADDAAICGGIARFCGQPVTVIAQMKGHDTKDNIRRNFGMPKPEGYRKAIRLMKQAEKFHRPVICIVDTPGAYCGMEAEERGQGAAIAESIYEMSGLKTPVLSILIGEGGSGGALAMAVSDEIWMMENASYSILSPEGFASILWKDASLAEKAAKSMQLTSYDLMKNGFIEEIISEPDHYTCEEMDKVCEELHTKIAGFLQEKCRIPSEQLVEKRYNRFRIY